MTVVVVAVLVVVFSRGDIDGNCGKAGEEKRIPGGGGGKGRDEEVEREERKANREGQWMRPADRMEEGDEMKN